MKRVRKYNDLECPKCGSSDILAHGTKVSKKHGKRPRAFCLKCASTYYVDGEK